VSQRRDTSEAEYAERYTSPLTGPIADAADWTLHETSRPQMLSGLAELRLLQALIVTSGAKSVLEVGSFTGVGALMMAAAVGPGGRVTTLEFDPDNAAAVRRHLAASEYGDRVELIEGDALETIARLPGPFDLVYIDAWKSDYPKYYDAVVPKLADRGVIVADNLFRDGKAMDPDVDDEETSGIREFARRVHEDDRVDNVLLTIGDGQMLAWKRPAERP
jgi:caffeoyl-CoA O-methyltransferase